MQAPERRRLAGKPDDSPGMLTSASGRSCWRSRRCSPEGYRTAARSVDIERAASSILTAGYLAWCSLDRLDWWRVRDQLREAPEVLGDGREHELVLCATRATQTQPAQPQDALQVR